MDSLTIIIIVILIIIILVGYYLHKEMKRKIDIITVETVKNKSAMTSVIDEFSDTKKDISHTLTDFAHSIMGNTKSIDSLKKESFTISRNSNPMAMPQRGPPPQPFKMNDMKLDPTSLLSQIKAGVATAKSTARPSDGMAIDMKMASDPTVAAQGHSGGAASAGTAAALASIPVAGQEGMQGGNGGNRGNAQPQGQPQGFNVNDDYDGETDYIDEDIHPIQANFDELGVNLHQNNEEYF